MSQYVPIADRRYGGRVAGFGLVFGVGWAHESLRERGVGEIALSWLCRDLTTPTHWSIDSTTSAVHAEGDPSDLRRVLDELAERIDRGPTTLPKHKITVGSEVDGALLLRRFGNRSYGLAAATRYGYQLVDPAAVQRWLAQLGRETAVLFAAGFEPGAGPLGSVRPLPEPSRDQVTTTGLVPVAGGWGISWLRDCNPTAELASQIMVGSVASCLPEPSPGSGTVTGRYRSIGADTVHVGLMAIEPAVRREFTTVIVDRLGALRDHGPDELTIVNALDRIRPEPTPLERAYADADAELWRRAGYHRPEESLLDASASTLQEEIQRQCATLQLLCVDPPDSSWLRHAAGTEVVDAAHGRAFQPARAVREVGMPAQHRVVVGEDRITHLDQHRRTVTTDSVELVERWPDGERVLIDRSGTVLLVDPLVWSHGRQLVAWVDDHWPDQVVRSERLAPDQYVERAALRARPGVVTVLAGLVGVIGLVLLIAGATNPDDRLFPLIFGVLLLAAAAGSIPLLRYTRQLTRRVAR